MKFFATALAAILGTTDARMGFGACPTDITFQTIDQDQFAGTWYEVQRDALFPMELGAECVTSVYKKNAEGGMDYFYRGYYWSMFFQYMGVGGSLSDCDKGTPDTWSCKSTMNVSKSDDKSKDTSYPFKIISTNYDRWAIMYSCLAPMGDMMSMDFVWIYSRTQTLTDDEMAEVRSVIRSQMPVYNLTPI